MNPVKISAGPKITEVPRTNWNLFFWKRLLDSLENVSHRIFLVLQEQERPVLLLMPIDFFDRCEMYVEIEKKSDRRQISTVGSWSEGFYDPLPTIGDITGILDVYIPYIFMNLMNEYYVYTYASPKGKFFDGFSSSFFSFHFFSNSTVVQVRVFS